MLLDRANVEQGRPAEALEHLRKIPPERLRGQELDGRSDLYSLDILAFALLTGREPFADRPLSAIFLAHLDEEVADLHTVRPGTPDAWATYVQRLLAKSADDRFTSASAAIAALAGLPAT